MQTKCFAVFAEMGCVLTNLKLDLSSPIDIKMNADIGQEGIVIGMVYILLTNPVSI